MVYKLFKTFNKVHLDMFMDCGEAFNDVMIVEKPLTLSIDRSILALLMYSYVRNILMIYDVHIIF